MKPFSRRSLAILLLVALVWFCPAAHAADAIKIGAINPLSGRLSAHGREVLMGIETAISEANEVGGIRGRRLVLLSRDDQSQVDVAIARAEELCSWEKVAALTGGYVDSLVGAIAAVAHKYATPYVASASLQKELVNRGNRFFFRVSNLRGFVEPLCALLHARIRPQKLAIIHASTPGATELALDLEKCLAGFGIVPVLTEKFRPGTPDFTPMVAKMAALGVDTVVSGGFFPDHTLFVRQCKQQDFTPGAYIGPWGIAYQSFIAEMGPDAEYLLGTCAWNPGITLPGTEQESAAFIARYRRLFGSDPSTTSMHGYTSARALIEGMRRGAQAGKPLTGHNLRDLLAEIDLLLPMERLAFDSRGDPHFYEHVVVQIQHGKLVPVFPETRAAAPLIFPAPPWKRRGPS